MTASQHHDEEFTGRLDAVVWKTLLAYGKPYRRLFLILGLTGAITAGIDALFGLVFRNAIDHVAQLGRSTPLAPILLQYLGVSAGLFFCILVFINTAGRITALICHDIRRDAFRRLQDLELAYHDRRSVGWLLSRLTSDCDRLSRIIGWMLLALVWGSSLVV